MSKEEILQRISEIRSEITPWGYVIINENDYENLQNEIIDSTRSTEDQ